MPDNLLVNRDGQTYQVDMENTKSIQDTDLLLVNRNGTTYTVAGSEISRGEFSEVVITPTSIVPETSEQILTAVTDIPKVGDNVPADVYWTWYQYDQEAGEAGKKVLKTLTNREASDTLVLPAASAGKFIGCTVTYLSVTISETERCSVGVPPGPTAVMRGLRFDSARSNYLEGSKGTNKFTYSIWIKPTGRMRFLFMKDGTGGSFETVWEMNSNRLYFGNAGTAKLFPAQELELNKWQHVVLQNDPEGDCAIYLDGVLLSSEAGLETLDWDDQTLRIGVNTQGEGGDGYMSDVYYIADRIVPPTTFGKQFPEGWGPVDGTVVKAAFADEVQTPEQLDPYARRANTDQVWSQGGSFTGTTWSPDVTTLFNGDLSDGPSLTGNQTGTYTLASGITASSSIEIYMINGSNENQRISLTVDGVVYEINGPGNTWVDTGLTGSLTAITITVAEGWGSSGLRAIKVDGRQLVDQGVWNNSLNFSDFGDDNSTFPYTNLFNGIYDGQGVAPKSGTTTTWDIGQENAISGGSVAIYVTYIHGSPSGLEFRVNGDLVDVNGWGAGNWYTIPGITSIYSVSTTHSGSGWIEYGAIMVNGALLVDSGYQWNTSEVWSDLIDIPQPTAANYPRGTFTGTMPPADTPASGNVATIDCDPDGIPDSATLPYTTNNSTVRIYYKQNPQYSTLNSLTVGDKTSTTEVDLGNQLYYVEVTGATGSTIEVTFDYIAGGGSTIYLLQYEVDGKVLTDKQIEWNTSEVWSRGLTLRYTGDTEFNSPPSRAFDGDYDTACVMTNTNSAADCSVTFTPSLPINVQNNIKVTWAINENYRGYLFQINDEDPVEINVYVKNTFTLPFTGTLNSLKIYSTNTISTGQNLGELYAIQVDDKLLVDQGNMGVNSFYLPFDTEGESTPDYPNLWDRNDMIVETPMFEGTPGKVYQTQKTSPDDEYQWATWTLPEPLGSNFEIAFRVVATGGYPLQGYANGEAITGGLYGGNPYVTPRRDFPLESVTLPSYSKEGGNALQNLAVEYIKVDGKILVDHRSIGADDSGAGNNFKDYNFIVGNNPAVAYTSTIDKSRFVPDNAGYSPPANIFDGNLDSYGSTRLGFGSNVYEFDWSGLNLPECKKLRIFIEANNGNGNDYLRVGLNDFTPNQLLSRNLDTYNGCWVDLSLASSYDSGDGFSDQFPLPTVTRLYIDLMQGNATEQRIHAIEYNGRLLMDASFADSVEDSPMKDFALLRNGTEPAQTGQYNGDLEAQGSNTDAFSSAWATQSMSTGKKYYWEVTPFKGGDSGLTQPNVGVGGVTSGSVFASYQNLGIDYGDVIGMTYDVDSEELCYYVNGVKSEYTAFNTGTPTPAPIPYFNFYGDGAPRTRANFGQQVFNYADDLGNGLVQLQLNDSQVWSDGQQAGDYNKPWTLAFDGNITNYEKGAGPNIGTISWAGNIPVSGSVKVTVLFQNTTSGGQSFLVNGVEVISAFTGVGASYSLQTRDISSYITADSITSMSLSRTVGEHGLLRILGISVGGRLLVDTGVIDTGPFSKLNQPWSEWVIQTLLAKGAEADALKVMLIDHAQTYDAAEDYCEGSVIQAFGELWIAVNEAPATTFADLPAILAAPNWERLNISVN